MSLAHALTAPAFATLTAWFSPAFPVGAFSYSHGLEALHAAGGLEDRAAAQAAIGFAVTAGGGRADLILLCHAYRRAAEGDGAAVRALAALGSALAPSAERQLETLRQGEAFAEVVTAAWALDGTAADMLAHRPLPHPVAVGVAGAAASLPLGALASAHGLAFAANLISAAVRLVPLGQTDGQRLTRALAGTVESTVAHALASDLDDLGTASLGLDLASMAHECQEVRLFRS